MKRSYCILLALAIIICSKSDLLPTYAIEGSYHVEPVTLNTRSIVSINRSFGEYQSVVDENIYYSLSSVNAETLVRIFGNANTPMFNMAKETINPCMAFGTTWGEAGQSYKGVSLTTVMDFDPDTYIDEIDWVTLSKNLEQVDSTWYLTNARTAYNTNEDGRAYHMPNALLQVPSVGNRQESTMIGLGVGPYQITSSDWDKWNLDCRVNPVWGWEDSLRKCGSSWINCGIDPISDLTVYACLSLGHQGGGLIDTAFGKSLIQTINTEEVQQAINDAGYAMFQDALEKSYSHEVALSELNVGNYIAQVQAQTGIDFSNFHGTGFGPTNKGSYVLKHCIRYVFYKYYYTSGK